jgi:receptor expression-enhancing protein 1/2/3/4
LQLNFISPKIIILKIQKPPATVPQQPQQKKPTPIRQTLSDRQAASTSANPPPESSTAPRLHRAVSGRSGPVPVTSTPTDSTESTQSVGTEPGPDFTDPEPSAPPAIIEEEEEDEAEEVEVVERGETEVEVPAETEETPMDEAIRMTRARLRKRVATSAAAPAATA